MNILFARILSESEGTTKVETTSRDQFDLSSTGHGA